MRNELVVQHLLPPRHFLALTSVGLHIVVKLRPVDILRQIILSSRGNDTKDLKVYHSFFLVQMYHVIVHISVPNHHLPPFLPLSPSLSLLSYLH
jgi:hypothetical protein